ncbi:flavodoxin [Paenibacillus sp. FSL W8-1187]|uniref:flavodoxin n=1 Tax=unclassified Paenibacillus TaxID=185978 RepID=UPI00129A16D9|nr:flavodoxin [Paenibacillus sp. B01]QGG58008.1 flavodoxin [Paenibacillus sp. B01]
MEKIILVCCSMTGNTEEMADAIAAGAREAGAQLTVRDILDAEAAELEQYDGIFIGAYTWGEGDLPDESLDLYEGLDAVDLAGKTAMAFGSGDTSYDIYCGAVDQFEAKLAERGAAIFAPGFKVEFNPSDEEKEQLRELGRRMAELTVEAL